MLCISLYVVPEAFLASRAFTFLWIALFAFGGARVLKGKWRRVPIGLAIPAAPVLAMATTVAFVYLDTPFWVDAGLRARTASSQGVPLYVVSHGWHTSLAFSPSALDDATWSAAFGDWADDLRTAPYVEWGWGDAGFFQAEEVTLGLTIDAFVTPSPTVLHVARLATRPDAAFPEAAVVRLELEAEQLGALAQFLAQTYALGADRKPVMTSPGDYGPASRFVAANGLYYFPNTCNVWTARGLAAAGVPVTPELAITSKNMLAQAARFGARLR